ncbi:MAG: hypothetical protein ACXAC6_05660 [Candidatus Hodarchaeales archaeon]
MASKSKAVQKKNFFIFTALGRETDKEIKPKLIRIFFLISLGITGIFAGIRGIFYSAFSTLRRYPGEMIGDWPNEQFIPNNLTFNMLKGLELAVLEITFFIILFFIFQNIHPVQSNKKSVTMYDIALAAQASVIKDILFLIYSFIYTLKPLEIYGEAWNRSWQVRSYYGNMISLYDSSLYLLFVLIIIIFFMTRIIARLKSTYPDHNKQVFLAFILSTVIFGVAALLLSIIKILIDLPLGFT